MPPIIQDTGRNGLPRIVLAHASGARAELYRHGAHLTSWKNAAGAEQFFLSRKSWFAPGRPIRGGIPIVFPQFCDDGPLPKHGFARTREWALAGSGVAPSGEVFATLRLEADAETLRLWPFRFSLECRVTLGDSLAIRLAVVNRDEKPLSFQVALHTYFRVADIRRVGVLGLQGVELSDSLRQGAREKESREVIAFDRETDRIYRAAPGKLAIRDGAGARVIRLEKSGLADAVVWNPWIEKSRRMEDFGDEEYQTMVCVETGNISEPVKLDPERRWEGATVFYSQPLLKPARP